MSDDASVSISSVSLASLSLASEASSVIRSNEVLLAHGRHADGSTEF